MTNREYLEQKKEALLDRLNNSFERNIRLVYIINLLIDVVLFIAVCKVSIGFLVLFIPWTIFNFGFSFAMIQSWLDKEYKEKE